MSYHLQEPSQRESKQVIVKSQSMFATTSPPDLRAIIISKLSHMK